MMATVTSAETSPVEHAVVTTSEATLPSLRRFVIYRLFSEIELTGGIWILFLHERGFSLAEIGIAEASFHLAPISLELLSGSLADVVGRKWSLAIGGVLVALSAALMLVAHSLWLVAPAMYLGGASYAFRSGAQQAFLYDTLAASARSDRFMTILARLLSLSLVVLAATTLAGAGLAELSFAWPYGLMIVVGLVVAWLAAGLREPERERTDHRSLVRTIGEALTIVRGQPGLAALLCFSAALWTLLTLIALYAQAVLQEHGLSTWQVGGFIAASLVCTAAGSGLAARLSGRGRFSWWTIATAIAMVAGGLGLGSGLFALGVVTYLVAEFVSGLYEPVLATRVNGAISAAQRATILSIEGFLFSFTMIWAFPLFGRVAEQAGWFIAYVGAGAIVVLLLVLWLAIGQPSRVQAAGDELDALTDATPKT